MEIAEKINISIGKIKTRESEYRKVLAVTALAAGAFFVSRVMFMDEFFPCSIALMAVALSKNKIGIYLLPGVLLGMGAFMQKGYYIGGDMAAAILVALILWLTASKKLSWFWRSVIIVGSTTVCKLGYALITHTIYRLDAISLMAEITAIGGLIYVFSLFWSFAEGGEKKNMAYGCEILALSGVWCLVFCGVGTCLETSSLADSIAQGGGYFITLLAGYRMGVNSGMIAGAMSGIMLFLCGAAPSSEVLIYIVGGIAAGAFFGMNKYTAAACFAAVTTVTVLALYGMYEPMAVITVSFAAVAMALMPQGLLNRISVFLWNFSNDKNEAVKINQEVYQEVLLRCRREFDYLMRLYRGKKDCRRVMSHQFEGMTQIMDRIMGEMGSADVAGAAECANAVGKERYSIKAAVSRYAGGAVVSGDSCELRHLKDGRYLMMLSDGMGKGEPAAAESGLVVKTVMGLVEAGFETETALKALNSMLLINAKEEVFSTADLGIFDGKTGRMGIYKVGAAPTFVAREGKVGALKMATLPMGIVEGMHIDFVNMRMRNGDRIVMVSDGVTDSKKHSREDEAEYEWLEETIASIRSSNPQVIADMVVNKAVANYGVREKDDITVISAVVERI